MAQNFKCIDPSLIGAQKINEASSTQNHPLGRRIKIHDDTDGPGEAIYLQGKTNTVIGSWVFMDMDNYSTTLTDATSGTANGPIAVALSACDANTKYGWYGIYGKIEAQMAASFADDGKVYMTTTPGVADDAAVANCRINGAKGAETIVGAGLAECQLSYPYCDADTD